MNIPQQIKSLIQPLLRDEIELGQIGGTDQSYFLKLKSGIRPELIGADRILTSWGSGLLEYQTKICDLIKVMKKFNIIFFKLTEEDKANYSNWEEFDNKFNELLNKRVKPQ